MHLYANGTDVVVAFDFVNLAGGTATLSSLTVTGSPVFSGTGAATMPVGTVAQRPSPSKGMFRFNDDTDEFEGYDGSAWGSIGGGGQAGGAILVNNDTATVSYTIASGENGLSVGPVTVDSGVTITVSSGQRWLVL
jgi:hypothetical protein